MKVAWRMRACVERRPFSRRKATMVFSVAGRVRRTSCAFLEKGGFGMLVVKAKSISQQSDVAGVFGKEVGALGEQFKVKQVVNLHPFEKDHVLALCEKL